MAIKSFRNEATRDIAEGVNSKIARALLPVHLHHKGAVLCSALASAQRLEDLLQSPSWRLEKLHGDRKGQYSIRINKQFRICFVWTGRDAESVEIIDYH